MQAGRVRLHLELPDAMGPGQSCSLVRLQLEKLHYSGEHCVVQQQLADGLQKVSLDRSSGLYPVLSACCMTVLNVCVRTATLALPNCPTST